MRSFHLVLTTVAIGCGTLSGPASAFTPSDWPRDRLIHGARIVCDEFDRCFRIGPFGRRVILPRDDVWPGPGPRGYRPRGGDGPDMADGPARGPGYGPPPRPGFDEPGYGERSSRREGDDRDEPGYGRPRRRDDPGFDQRYGGRPDDDRYGKAYGDGGPPRMSPDDGYDADGRGGPADDERPHRRAGGPGSFGRGGSPGEPDDEQ